MKSTQDVLASTLPLFNLLLKQEQQSIQMLFNKIRHGDDKHRAWLKEELEKFFDVKLEDKDFCDGTKLCRHHV